MISCPSCAERVCVLFTTAAAHCTICRLLSVSSYVLLAHLKSCSNGLLKLLVFDQMAPTYTVLFLSMFRVVLYFYSMQVLFFSQGHPKVSRRKRENIDEDGRITEPSCKTIARKTTPKIIQSTLTTESTFLQSTYYSQSATNHCRNG